MVFVNRNNLEQGNQRWQIPRRGGTPYDDQCTMLGGLDPHFRAWLDPIGSIFRAMARSPNRVHFRAWLDSLDHELEIYGNVFAELDYDI